MKHVPLSYWAQFNHAFAKPGRMQLGELLDGDPSAVARTWREGHFTSMFDFPLAFAMADVFCRDQSPAKLAAVLTNDRRYPDPSQLVTLLDNHDLPRIASLCGHDAKRIERALRFLLATRGIPSLTWGTEIGLDGEKEPETRKSMRFISTPVKAMITEALTQRADNPALRDGASSILAVDDKHLIIGRAHAAQLSVIVVNQTSEAYSPALAAPWPSGSFAPGVSVRNSGVGDFAALSKSLDEQWRTGAHTTRVTFNGTGGKVVGSGHELGDWNPSRAPAVPVTLELPVGGVFEFKFISDSGAWAEGENHVIIVKSEPFAVDLR